MLIAGPRSCRERLGVWVDLAAGLLQASAGECGRAPVRGVDVFQPRFSRRLAGGHAVGSPAQEAVCLPAAHFREGGAVGREQAPLLPGLLGACVLGQAGRRGPQSLQELCQPLDRTPSLNPPRLSPLHGGAGPAPIGGPPAGGLPGGLGVLGVELGTSSLSTSKTLLWSSPGHPGQHRLFQPLRPHLQPHAHPGALWRPPRANQGEALGAFGLFRFKLFLRTILSFQGQ